MVEPSVPLLETKLHAPRRRRVVARPRPRERLERCGQPALTLVSAGAGFGKTTLVADGLSTAWLSLDRRDNDPALFWAYVGAALHAARPEVTLTARSLLDAPELSIDAMVSLLLNDLQWEYMRDLDASVKQTLTTLDPTPFFEQYGPSGNAWAIFKTYLDAAAHQAAAPVVDKYLDKLGGADVFTLDNAFALFESLRIDAGALGPFGIRP